MNIYNKLFILEYTKDPNKKQFWLLNLSKNKCHYYHRDFDLPSYINESYIIWHQYNQFHRLIGPAHVVIVKYRFFKFVVTKRMYIRGVCIRSF